MIRYTLQVNCRSFAKLRQHQDIHIREALQFLQPQGSIKGKQRFYLKINEAIPQNATQFPLNNLNIHHFPDTPQFINIPTLQHGLHKYLSGKLQIGDSGVGVIPTSLSQQMMKDMSGYIPPSQDTSLLNKSLENKCKYFSSTSSISSPLIQLYFIFSMFRRPDFTNIFEDYPNQPRLHMVSFRKPVTFFLDKKDKKQQIQTYSIQADKGISEQKTNEILLKLGTVAEYFLTTRKQTIQRMMDLQKVEQKTKSYYRYALVNNNMLLRSQIDCRHVGQDGQPIVFEIKTRACAPIRYDVQNWQKYIDYPMIDKKGLFQSFQREYYDLIRGGFLKYAFQLKIGQMDGAFIAFHNTQKVYGYQYVKMKQIVLRLFGDSFNLDLAFTTCSKMLTEILDYLLAELKDYEFQKLKLGFYANAITKSLIVMVQVMTQMKEYPLSSIVNESTQEYFDKHIPVLRNPVYKYEFSFFTLMNNILIRHPQIYFRKHDHLGMRWTIKKYGRVIRQEYIQFLHEAYKQDFIFGNQRYSGSWIQTNQLV